MRPIWVAIVTAQAEGLVVQWRSAWQKTSRPLLGGKDVQQLDDAVEVKASGADSPYHSAIAEMTAHGQDDHPGWKGQLRKIVKDHP